MSASFGLMPLITTVPPLLHTARFGRPLRWCPVTGSTNADALAWAAEGAPEGAVVGTEHQTTGRGRHGRVWSDTPGLNLLFSIVLRPTLPPERLGLVPLAAGVAVAEALAPWTDPVVPQLKWPNDVLLGGHKTAGLLLEGHHAAGGAPTYVLGLGLNVNQTDFSAGLADRATSLALEVGRPLPRAALLADLLLALERHYDALLRGETEPLCSAFEARMAGRGAEASVAFTGGRQPRLQGRILGVDRTGALRLVTAEGIRTLSAGEVTLAGGATSHEQ